MQTPIKKYLNQLKQNINTGSAQEHSHRAALENLIETLAPHVNAVNEPVRIACGAPDYVVLSKENNIPLGYIEAKNIGVSLEPILKTEQLKRYLDSLNNLILTDYLEFRWFVEGESKPEMTVRLAEIDKNGILKQLEAAESDFVNLIEAFLNTRVITLKNPTDLAQRLAKIARLMRAVILKAYQQEKDSSGSLHMQLESFRQVLLDELTAETFADMYAQTICYGLFAARGFMPAGETFYRMNAAYHLPKTNPFLRSLFNQIAGVDLDERLVWAVEHLVEVLNRADIASILADFGKRTRQEDPVVHFYETFLAQYDPKLREMRGVYYTPEPVVSYIVRSVDLLLKQVFKLKNGLADSSKIQVADDEVHKVQILDPAVGTGTFLYALIEQIYQKFRRNKGMWSNYVKQHLLPRVHGFELLMAPYTVAHIKLGLQLQEKGYNFQSEERLRIFLTNTLDEPHTAVQQTMMAQWLSKEANAAKEVKTDMPVMVIIGNPPYSGHSANTGGWIKELLRGGDGANQIASYFEVDGKPLKERNPKWLNDDYIKFIRFAHWRIMQTGYGILGFVTNHGYLDNPTFCGMRQSLMQDFDDIYILDLHGNAKKKEISPDGCPDQNVFDIQQGVAISILVKNNQKKTEYAKVSYAQLWGKREDKYRWLAKQDISNTEWTELKPQSPFYLFVPQNVDLLAEYKQGWKVTEMMPVNSVGIVTARDKLTIHDSAQAVMETVLDFASLKPEPAREKYQLDEDTRDWKVHLAQADINEHNLDKSHVVPILYRPFDTRYTYYTGQTRGFICMPRLQVMQHILAGDNLAFISARSNKSPNPDHFFCTQNLVETKCAESTTQSYFFPLYLYPTKTDEFLNGNGNGTQKPLPARKPNFAEKFIKDVENRLALRFIKEGQGNFQTTVSATNIFHYMYAIFHAPSYRQRYAEFLKIDFPRLPLTSDKALFQQLALLGAKLVKIHLMEDEGIESDSGFPIEGDNKIETITYKDERIYINKTQYFDNVKPEVWQFQIGGYKVCQKWLKDRKGRRLSYDDCEPYLYIIAALEKTIGLMTEIDEVLSGFQFYNKSPLRNST
jgi:predicted helicase